MRYSRSPLEGMGESRSRAVDCQHTPLRLLHTHSASSLLDNQGGIPSTAWGFQESRQSSEKWTRYPLFTGYFW